MWRVHYMSHLARRGQEPILQRTKVEVIRLIPGPLQMPMHIKKLLVAQQMPVEQGATSDKPKQEYLRALSGTPYFQVPLRLATLSQLGAIPQLHHHRLQVEVVLLTLGAISGKAKPWLSLPTSTTTTTRLTPTRRPHRTVATRMSVYLMSPA